jgi:hypothetical protein
METINEDGEGDGAPKTKWAGGLTRHIDRHTMQRNTRLLPSSCAAVNQFEPID